MSSSGQTAQETNTLLYVWGADSVQSQLDERSSPVILWFDLEQIATKVLSTVSGAENVLHNVKNLLKYSWQREKIWG